MTEHIDRLTRMVDQAELQLQNVSQARLYVDVSDLEALRWMLGRVDTEKPLTAVWEGQVQAAAEAQRQDDREQITTAMQPEPIPEPDLKSSKR